MWPLFTALLNYLFPPVFFLALAGLAYFTWKLWRSGRRDLIGLGFVLLMIAIMFRWREGLFSGRYILIFIPMGIFSCIYFLYRVKLPLWFVRSILLIVVVAALLKVTRTNPYSDFVKHAGQLIREDARKYHRPVIIDFTQRTKLLVYYSGIDNHTEVLFPASQDPRRKIADYMLDFRYRGDVVYVVMKERSDAAPIGREEIDSPDGDWQLLGQRFYNRKKEHRMAVYKFVPRICFAPDVRHADETKMFLVDNGDFERPGMKNEIAEINALHKRGILFFDDPSLKLPAGWSPNPGQGYSGAWKGMAALVGTRPLAGKHSLRLSGNGTSMYLLAPVGKAGSGPIRVSLLARAEADSRFSVWLYFYDRFRFIRSLNTGYISVDGTGEKQRYRFTFGIPPDLLGKTFRISIFLVNGEMVFDEVSTSLAREFSQKEPLKP